MPNPSLFRVEAGKWYSPLKEQHSLLHQMTGQNSSPTQFGEPMEKEYCVMMEKRDGVHRGPWPKEKCEAWVQECIDEGMRDGAFFVAEREVGEWKKVNKNGPEQPINQGTE